MKIILPAVLLGVAVSGCTQLSDGLQAVNDTLSEINSTMAGSSGNQVNSVVSLGNKSTKAYELKNLKMTVRHTGFGSVPQADVTFAGEAYNKTNRLIVITIRVPIYDRNGFFVAPVMTDIHIPAQEKVKINQTAMTVSLTEGNRLNPQKATYRLD